MVEYALLVGLIAVVAVVAITALGGGISGLFSSANNSSRQRDELTRPTAHAAGRT